MQYGDPKCVPPGQDEQAGRQEPPTFPLQNAYEVLSKLPPVPVVFLGTDLSVEEGVPFGLRLQQAGVDCHHQA